MQTIIDAAVAAVAWAVTIFKFNAVRRHRQRNQDGRVLTSWAFALFFSLCMTFQVDAIYVTVDALVGVNNLSWLLAYLCLVLALYLVCIACCLAMKRERPRWMLAYPVVTAGLLVAIFPFGIVTTPEWTEHTVPRAAPELLFMELLYLYAIVMGVMPALSFARFYCNEGLLPTRLRISLILLTVILAITFFVVKAVVSLLGFFHPSLPPVLYLTDMARFLMAASGLLWALTFAPNGLYLALARPFMFREKVLTLRDLRRLQARLNRLCPPVALDHVTWWDQLRNLDFHIYRTVIGILDGRKMLAARLEQRGQGAGEPGSKGAREHLCSSLACRPRQAAPQLLCTDEEAIRLHRALQGVPEPQDFDGLVAAYGDLGRRLDVRVR